MYLHVKCIMFNVFVCMYNAQCVLYVQCIMHLMYYLGQWVPDGPGRAISCIIQYLLINHSYTVGNYNYISWVGQKGGLKYIFDTSLAFRL